MAGLVVKKHGIVLDKTNSRNVRKMTKKQQLEFALEHYKGDKTIVRVMYQDRFQTLTFIFKNSTSSGENVAEVEGDEDATKVVLNDLDDTAPETVSHFGKTLQLRGIVATIDEVNAMKDSLEEGGLTAIKKETLKGNFAVYA